MAPVNTVRVVLAIAVVLGANGCYRMERLSNAASDAGRDDANVRDASEGGLDGASSADASLPSDGGSETPPAPTACDGAGIARWQEPARRDGYG